MTLHNVSPYPTTFTHLANWLGHLLQSSVAVATAQSYLTGVRNYHVDRGLDIVAFNDERIKRIIKGAKRIVKLSKRVEPRFDRSSNAVPGS